MNSLEEQLRQLVEKACSYPPGNPQRRKNLTKIIRLIRKKLWYEYTPYYQDALQQTWVYFCQNICEGKDNTGKAYNPERATIVTWLNYYLKRRLQDFRIETHKERDKTVKAQVDSFGDANQTMDLVENIAAEPEVPPLLEQLYQWVQKDPDGELSRIKLKGSPVTAQILIKRRLPPEESWKDLAAEFGLPISTLSSFYQRKCLPILRKFGESEGYL
ncbi:MAG: sigma-70 family RNA polymerase sigma factor [Symploca sp. SIO1A3]|nr:sigma-70 family RNA polymerase sigma factor [Symploca sp. SIO1A3]